MPTLNFTIIFDIPPENDDPSTYSKIKISNPMTALFRRINPAQKFRITKRQIAQFLGISKSLIVKVESWLYVLFVHRLDKGGQFISYRQMEQWKNAVACHLQKCSTWEQLEHLWNAVKFDHTKHPKQYVASVLPFLDKIRLKCLEAISPELPVAKVQVYDSLLTCDRALISCG